MKKLLLVLLLVFVAISVNCQTKDEMLQELNGQYNIDESGNVTLIRVVNDSSLKKIEIYNRVLNYFTYNYGSGKSVIQTQDKEAGLIVGKGLYENAHIGMSLITTYISTWHIIRVDVKEGKARVVITLTTYDKKITGGNTPPTYLTTNISQEFPVNPNGRSETVMTKAFYKSHKKAMASLDAIEKAIKDGNTSKALEGDSW